MDPDAIPKGPRPLYIPLSEPDTAKGLRQLADLLTEKLADVAESGPDGVTAVFEVNLTAVISLGFDAKTNVTREDVYQGLVQHLAAMDITNDLAHDLDEAKLIELRRE